MEELAVAGVGMTRFTKQPERSPESLVGEAVRAALRDAGVARDEIQASFVGNVQLTAGTGQRVLKDLGLTGPPVINVENACASSTTALNEAAMWIHAGMAETVLVVGVESLSRHEGVVGLNLDDPISGMGAAWPAMYALKARAKMEQGLTVEQLALVAVKNRRHAMANPYAHFRTPISVSDVLASRPVADPITLLQCCPRSDGASAVVLTTLTRGRELANGRPIVRLAGSALNSGVLNDQVERASDATVRTSRLAYERAGIGPEDVDVCEVHDAFTIGEILHCESLGFCAAGAGGRYVEAGKSALGGGGVVVNPSGGLLSRGHPLGATGTAQIAELSWQLRREAGDRQVEGARVAVSHTMGGTVYELETNVCAVHVLKV
ncbi:thiolase family protein [Pseudonocardia nigra]|uniref:thiolase family protein n=1 Tax=Pseudonocardia nigra TaxID=1921578 RepID=UPI001C606227|nr:thiolase family protein [Pseudonocardia nigra]